MSNDEKISKKWGWIRALALLGMVAALLGRVAMHGELLVFQPPSTCFRRKPTSETCSTRKTGSRDVLFVVSETPGEIFRDETNRWL